MSDSLRSHAEDIADSILNDVASELELALSQQNDEILEDENKDSTDETANLMVTDESGSSNDDQRTDASIENIQVDDVDSNSEIGNSTDKLDPIPDSHKNTPEIQIDYKEKSKKYVPTCDEKNIVEIEENIKGRITPTLEEPETSSESLSDNSNAPVATDLCSKVATLLGTLELNSSKTQLNIQNRISEVSLKISNYLSKLQREAGYSSEDAENSTAANNPESNVLDQTSKEKKSSLDNNESILRNEEAEDSSGKNESKPEETSDDRIDLRNKNAGELKSDGEPIPGCSKDSPAAEKCQEIHCRRKEDHGPQPSCKLSSIIGDLNIRKTSEEKNDSERNVSNDGSQEGGSKDTKQESKAPDLESKNPLKRNRDSQPDAPSAKYRRRCISTRSAETGEENTSRHHFRFISADAKKCSVDEGTGQAGSLTSTLEVFQSRKRKVDKGSKTLLKEFAFNTKRFKQNETSSSEKESSDEDSD